MEALGAFGAKALARLDSAPAVSVLISFAAMRVGSPAVAQAVSVMIAVPAPQAGAIRGLGRLGAFVVF